MPALRTTTASLGLAALALTACGGAGGAAPATAEAAQEALVASVGMPAVTTISFDGTVDLEEVAQLVALGDPDDADPNDPDAQEFAEVFDTFVSNFAMTITTGEDQTGAFSFDWAGEAAIAVAFDGSDAPVFDDPQQYLDADPYEFGIYVLVDLDTIKQVVEAFGEDASGIDDGLSGFDPAFLPGDIGALATAALEGRWVGIDGTIDPAALEEFSQLGGMGFGDLGDMPVMDPDDAVAIFLDPLSVGTPDGNTASIGYDFGAMFKALLDSPAGFAARADPMASAMLGDLDLDLVDVGEVTFDGDLVTEIRIDLVEAILQGAEQASEDGTADGVDLAEARDVVAGWSNTTLDLVISVSDHGSVSSAMDVVQDPTTISWDDLTGLLGGFLGGLI